MNLVECYTINVSHESDKTGCGKERMEIEQVGERVEGSIPDAIQLRGLRKEYARGDGVHGLDLSIPQGCSFGLLGPNGAGKSTTIKMLMGLITPTAGDALILGTSVREDPERLRMRVGYVPERHHVYPWMSVGEVIWFTRAFYPTWDETLTLQLLKNYGLSTGKKVKELSHGMLTKLALILALAHDPDVLLLDEPTTGLDPLIREEFLDGIKHLLRKRPRTLLFSSHILSDIEKVAETIGIINEGKLLICAERKDLLRKTRRLHVSLKEGHRQTAPPGGTVFEEFSDGCWRLTVHGFSEDTLGRLEQQNDVAQVNVHEIGLEDIFKDFIKGARKG